MPRFERASAVSGPLIQGFVGPSLRIDGQLYEGVLLTPEGASVWSAPALSELAAEHLQPLLQLRPAPEFVLLGTGSAMAFAPRSLVRELDALGIGVEAMDSRAAARTWGILRGEERWIAAAIMPL